MTMNRNLLHMLSAWVLAIAASTLATSCTENEELGQYSAYFMPTRPAGIELYADQTRDSTTIVSTISWDITTQATTGEDGWLRFSPGKADVVPNGQLFQRVNITAEANTTGYIRESLMKVNLHTDRIDGIAMPIRQLGWMDITVPQPRFTTDDKATMQPIFESTLKASDINATMVCHIFTMATLKSDAEWLVIPEELQSIRGGDRTLIFSVEPNHTGTERTAHVTLTSTLGCSNVVTFIQKAE